MHRFTSTHHSGRAIVGALSQCAGPIVVALLAIMALTLLIQSVRAAEDVNQRVQCARNLRQIGQGLMLYSTNYRTYPRTRYDATQPPTAFTTVGEGGITMNETDPFFGRNRPAVNDVTAALFLLVRAIDVSPTVFVCPSTKQVPDDLNNQKPSGRVNFSSERNLSYSYAMPYPSVHSIGLGYRLGPNVIATFAIMADRNDGDLDGNLSATSASPMEVQRAMNSRNHGGDGQNVLYNDGHVEWRPTCWAGDQDDCIWGDAAGILPGPPPTQARPARTGNGVQPRLELDSILLPKKGLGFPAAQQ